MKEVKNCIVAMQDATKYFICKTMNVFAFFFSFTSENLPFQLINAATVCIRVIRTLQNWEEPKFDSFCLLSLNSPQAQMSSISLFLLQQENSGLQGCAESHCDVVTEAPATFYGHRGCHLTFLNPTLRTSLKTPQTPAHGLIPSSCSDQELSFFF